MESLLYSFVAKESFNFLLFYLLAQPIWLHATWHRIFYILQKRIIYIYVYMYYMYTVLKMIVKYVLAEEKNKEHKFRDTILLTQIRRWKKDSLVNI